VQTLTIYHGKGHAFAARDVALCVTKDLDMFSDPKAAAAIKKQQQEGKLLRKSETTPGQGSPTAGNIPQRLLMEYHPAEFHPIASEPSFPCRLDAIPSG
jgi:hypothetical protein